MCVRVCVCTYISTYCILCAYYTSACNGFDWIPLDVDSFSSPSGYFVQNYTNMEAVRVHAEEQPL